MQQVTKTLCLFLLFATLSPAAFGQQGRLSTSLQTNMSRFIEPPRLMRQALKDAEAALQAKQYSEAVVTLGDLLERSGEGDDRIGRQDYFLDVRDAQMQRIDTSFLRRCRDLIGDLPEAGINTYELRYGPAAQQLLNQATAARNWDALREVRRKYFHTQSGYDASLLLAQRELNLGHPLSASLLLDDLVKSPHAIKRLGDSLRIMHAVSRRLSGRSIPREIVNIAFPDGNDDATDLTTGDWEKWIDQRYRYQHTDNVRSSDYSMLGGDSSRNDTAAGQLPLSSPRWMVETTATPREDQLLRKKVDELAASGRLVPASWTPIRIGDQLLMRTTERLMGVDFQTGKRVWQYPWYQTDDPDDANRTSVGRSSAATDPAERLARRVWNDLPYGQISSDGQRVFLLRDLTAAKNDQINPLMGFRGSRDTQDDGNTLVALELATEGKMLWRIGKDATIDSELNDAYFLGVPISVDGYLFTIIEMAGDISLVCLDPATGKLQWQQQLVANEGWGVQFNPMRRSAGAVPSYHEGVLICPTGAGATVAVDLGDRTLRWGNTYPRKTPYSSNGQSIQRSTMEMLQRWHNPCAMASGNTVIVTPVETDQLYCFDLADGVNRFSKPRVGAFYAAGIRGDRFFIVGSRTIKCFDTERGRPQWISDATAVNSGQQFVGRGVFGKDCYIVPTTNNELLKYSLADGTLMESRAVNFPLGNLIAVDGEIISQSSTQLAVAYGSETLGPRVEELLKQDPDNLDALIQKSLLLVEEGKREESLAVLERAREIDPDNDEVQIRSINAMLGMLREKQSPPEDLVAELDRLIDTPSQRMQFLALQIDSALASRSVEKAADLLTQFSMVIAREPLLGNEDDLILDDPTRDCDLDGWIAARCAELLEIARAEEKQDVVAQKILAYLDTKALDSYHLQRQLIDHFHPVGVEQWIVSVANQSLVERNYLAAERILMGDRRPLRLRDGQDHASSRDIDLALANVYAEGRLGRDTLAVLDASQQREASRGGDGADADQVAELRRLARESIGPGATTMTVDGKVDLTWRSQQFPGGMRSNATMRFIDMSYQGSESFKGWSVVNLGNTVVMLNPLGEQRRFFSESSRVNPDRRATLSGGIMILERPGRISAVDLFAIQQSRLSDAALWSRVFGSDSDGARKRRSSLTPLGDTVSYYPTESGTVGPTSEFRVGPVLGDRILVLQAGELVALRLTDGETLWRNASAPRSGQMIANDRELIMVTTSLHQAATLTRFNLLDGQTIGQEKWDHGTVWTTSGKNVLTYSESLDNNLLTVRVVDPFSDRVLLETEWPKSNAQVGKGLGRVLDDRYLVLFHSEGRLVIWDLAKGTELAQHELGEMPELETLQAMWMDGQILVLPANAITRSSSADMNTRHGETHHSVNKLIAVSTENGQINWRRDFDQPWGCTIHQPFGSPVMLLARSKAIYGNGGNQSRTIKMDVAMLRLSDGETIHQEMEKELAGSSSGLNTVMFLQPLQNQMIAQVGTEILIYRFVDSSDETETEAEAERETPDGEESDADNADPN